MTLGFERNATACRTMASRIGCGWRFWRNSGREESDEGFVAASLPEAAVSGGLGTAAAAVADDDDGVEGFVAGSRREGSRGRYGDSAIR